MDVSGNELKRGGVRLDVPLIEQRPELPTGCEITSVTQMLVYAGVKADKLSLANEMKRHPDDPNMGFVGNPFEDSGMTVYPDALKWQIEKYTGSYKDLTGTDTAELEARLSCGRPVVAWVGGFHGFNTHAIVLTGYDESSFYYNDCWTGQKDAKIDKGHFLSSWELQDRRALSY